MEQTSKNRSQQKRYQCCHVRYRIYEMIYLKGETVAHKSDLSTANN